MLPSSETSTAAVRLALTPRHARSWVTRTTSSRLDELGSSFIERKEYSTLTLLFTYIKWAAILQCAYISL